MPSLHTLLLNSRSNSSSSSSENDSKSDQSDEDEDDDDEDIKFHYYKRRTIGNENEMLERPSDDDDESCSQTDESDNEENENDLIPLTKNSPSDFLTRQLTFYDNDWPKKSERNETLFFDSKQSPIFSPERSKSVNVVDQKNQSHNILLSDFTASAQELQSIPVSEKMPTVSLKVPTKTNTAPSPIYTSIIAEETRHPTSKIPIRTHSSSKSRSRSPTTTKTTNRHVQSPSTASKIPVPISTTSKGAFRFFTADDRPSRISLHPTTDSTHVSKQPTKQLSPFTPITQTKTLPLAKKSSSSAGNTPSARYRQALIPSSDDDNDSETNNLKEEDLKLKLKEQKRHGKKTGELLNQLHENYEELLEKYAQAENTIDQLRFQPKIFGDNTPPSNVSEGTIHFIQQSKMNMANLRSNGVHHTSSGSSLRQIPSTTTTTTTPGVKSSSPANSYTVESVFFDDPVAQTILVQELSTPETIKLDLLIQTKTLSDKMKSFITLMDANQLSLAEQQQVYESIKEDYEKLLKTLDRTKRGSDLSDIDFDGDLNQELETMKQLLKEIVKRITDNLLGKSMNESETGRQSRLTHDGSQSSQLSARSSLCNHADLMNQYQKLLNAVNTGVQERKTDIKPLHTGSDRTKKTNSRDSSQSDVSGRLSAKTKNQKPCVYVSGNSDDDQHQTNRISPVSSIKRKESTSFSFDYIPSTSTKHHQQINEEQTHIHGLTKTVKKKKSPTRHDIQEYDNLENITKTKRKARPEEKKHHHHRYQTEKKLSPSAGGDTRYSAGSLRTRTSDHDSGIGTNNTTKLSRDRLNTSTMDESHYQMLDEERRRYSDGEQESMSSDASSRSSGSGATYPRNNLSKYTKRYENSLSLKQLNENCRRKPSGHSDVYQSDIETHITGSFDPIPQPSSTYQQKSRRSHHSWQPQRTNSHRSRLTPTHRSISISSRPQTAPQSSSRTTEEYQMARKYQSGFIHQQTGSTKYPNTMYKSSFYINQPHTHRPSNEKFDQKQIPTSQNLYLNPQTGVIYRYVTNQNQPSTMTYHQTNAPNKTSRNVYQCAECGSITTYHHRHHINSNTRRIATDIDDPGYESGNRKISRDHRHIGCFTSSDSELDETPMYMDMSTLNEAYERARKVQHRSQSLSKHISRHLKLVLSTI